MRNRLWAAITAALLSTLAWPAGAQEAQQRACGPLDQVEAKLAAEYLETRQGQGITQSGQAMLMLYASPSGSWTVLMVTPDRLACFAAAGSDWQTRHDAAPVQETPL